MIGSLIIGVKGKLRKDMTFCVQGARCGILYKKHLAVWLPDGVHSGIDFANIPHNPAFCDAIDFMSANGHVRSIKNWRKVGVFVENISTFEVDSKCLIIGHDIVDVVSSWTRILEADGVSFKDEGRNVVKVVWDKGDKPVLVGVLSRMLPSWRYDLFSDKYTSWPKF